MTKLSSPTLYKNIQMNAPIKVMIVIELELSKPIENLLDVVTNRISTLSDVEKVTGAVFEKTPTQ